MTHDVLPAGRRLRLACVVVCKSHLVRQSSLVFGRTVVHSIFLIHFICVIVLSYINIYFLCSALWYGTCAQSSEGVFSWRIALVYVSTVTKYNKLVSTSNLNLLTICFVVNNCLQDSLNDCQGCFVGLVVVKGRCVTDLWTLLLSH